MAIQTHILHVFSSFRGGGAQMRFASIANRFGDLYRHSIAAVDGAHDAFSLLSAGVPAEPVAESPARSSLKAPFYYARLLRQMRPDVLQTYNWGAVDAVMGGLLAGFGSIIHTEDGFNPDEAIRLKTRRVLTRRVVLNRIFKTVMPSQTLERIALTQYRISPERIQLIPNGVDVDRFQPRDGAAMRARLGVGEREFVIGAVGRLSPEKNLPLLVRAFASLGWNDARLVIMGGGPEEGAIRAAVEKAGIASRVILTGPVTGLHEYYAALDLFVISSDTEQMPLALLEAMASGRAAVCTNVGDCAAILDTSGSPEIVPRGDAVALASSMRRLREDRPLLSRLAARNRSRAVEVYPTERMFQDYRALYEAASKHGLARFR
jgi:glycosyltransferase involved in cell wall biosynthesis